MIITEDELNAYLPPDFAGEYSVTGNLVSVSAVVNDVCVSMWLTKRTPQDYMTRLLVINEYDGEELSVLLPVDRDQWPRILKAVIKEYLV